MRTNTGPTKEQLADFTSKRLMKIDADNYSGQREFDLVKVVGRTRDSDRLENSNFDVAFERLGGVETDDVQILRFGHWACGWIEELVVNPKNKAKLVEAWNIVSSIGHYPVLDEDDYHQREQDECDEVAKETWAQKTVLKQLLELTDIPAAILDDAILEEIARHCAYENSSYSGEVYVGDGLIYRVLKDGYPCGGGSPLDELCAMYGTRATK